MSIVISETDVEGLEVIRNNVVAFMKKVSATYVGAHGPFRLLDIAPQIHEGAKPFFPPTVTVETFDIDANSGCTYIGDICKCNSVIANNSFNYVVCTEVLEHVLQPFDAVSEIRRILKPGGFLFLSAPFNFRIHGPLPDCWRFTEHGLRALLAQFDIIELGAIETMNRSLMPIHYTVVAQKPLNC